MYGVIFPPKLNFVFAKYYSSYSQYYSSYSQHYSSYSQHYSSYSQHYSSYSQHYSSYSQHYSSYSQHYSSYSQHYSSYSQHYSSYSQHYSLYSQVEFWRMEGVKSPPKFKFISTLKFIWKNSLQVETLKSMLGFSHPNGQTLLRSRLRFYRDL